MIRRFLLLLGLLPTFVCGQDTFQKTGDRISAAALDRTKHHVTYDPAYFSLEYPGGDVPADKGVCTDVVIRTYRKLGVDLQKLVHEDMRKSFSKYPKNWGAKRPDKNIDHRRVPNLQRYFERQGAKREITKNLKSYEPGDVVAWSLNGRALWHIGVVVEPPGKPGERWIVHNIGSGPKLEDRLFEWQIIGHYRFHPKVESDGGKEKKKTVKRVRPAS